MKIMKLVIVLLTLTALGSVVLWSTPVLAQEAPAGAAAAGDAAAAKPSGGAFGKEGTLTLWQWFVVGGWAMWPLLTCSIICVGLIIRNYIALQGKKLIRPDLLPKLQESMQQLDVASARAICKANPTLLTNILDAGLERLETAGLDMGAMEKAMEEASTEQVSSYMVPINGVNTIAVVSPMLGLLGTVSGMIKAFLNISLGGMGKPEMLAGNIGEALITTEAGLVIAIPAMTFYFLNKNTFIKHVAGVGKNLGKLTDILRTYAQSAVTTQYEQPAQEEPPAQA